VDRINAIANPQMPKVGERFLGTVVKTTPFGAFVSLLPGQGRPGPHQQARRRQAHRQGRGRASTSGDKLQVEIQEIDARGKISLVPVAPRGGRPDRPGRPTPSRTLPAGE
jgi:polyribonucleotide nucleotidyltransferase